MLKRFLTYCLLLLPVCTVMADGVDHLGSVRRAATPLLLYSIEICYCSKEFGSFFSAHRAAGRRRGDKTVTKGDGSIWKK